MKGIVFQARSLRQALGCATLILLAGSCHKQDPVTRGGGEGTVCVNRLSPEVSDFGVSGAGLDSIYSLFSINNLSKTHLQFQSWDTFTEVNVDPGAYNGYAEQIGANQFFNGLPVFADEVFFDFYAGKYQPTAGAGGYFGPAPGPDTTTHQTLAGLRNAFLAKLPQSYFEGGYLNAQPFVPSASTYLNTCLNGTLGYLDAGRIPGNSVYGKELVKVWLVTPAADSSITYYPQVYVEDASGFAWGVPFFAP